MQLLRHEREVDREDLVVKVDVGYVVGCRVPSVDADVVHEDLEVEVDQKMLMTTAKTMKMARSRLEVGARWSRPCRRDLVEVDCVEEVVQKM